MRNAFAEGGSEANRLLTSKSRRTDQRINGFLAILSLWHVAAT
jgi:hypothetical protein